MPQCSSPGPGPTSLDLLTSNSQRVFQSLVHSMLGNSWQDMALLAARSSPRSYKSSIGQCTISWQPWGLDPANSTAFSPIGVNSWTIVSAAGTVTGLGHLNGLSVYALVDGAPQGPFTVVAGSITLTSPGFSIVVGLKYVPQLQQLPPVGTGPSSQGVRDRTIAVTVRLMNTGPGINIGQSFDTTDKFVSGFTSTDEVWNTPYQPGGLVTGDQRMNLNTGYGYAGRYVCIQMLDPLPVTVLSLISEIDDECSNPPLIDR
jgi:hypothetical protein